MSTSFLSKDLFNNQTFNIVCKLRNEDKIKTSDLLNIDNTEHAFIDKKFAQNFFKKIVLIVQELIKFKFIRKYDDKSNITVTHVIYSSMIVNEYRKSLISLLITKLSRVIRYNFR